MKRAHHVESKACNIKKSSSLLRLLIAQSRSTALKHFSSNNRKLPPKLSAATVRGDLLASSAARSMDSEVFKDAESRIISPASRPSPGDHAKYTADCVFVVEVPMNA